ncbi:MAG: tRNA (adenosine(37)-N6)-threonylcarbamoyltransferase complex ATPase subunit type 1 TsaE [Symbiobacteriia bacterium]
MAIAEFLSRSPADTQAFGRRLADRLQSGDVVLLEGDLGAGKTCLAQGICAGLGVTEAVSSPTFTIIHEYQGRLPVYHLDAYRLTGSAEAESLGLEEILGGEGVALVEWSERIPEQLPADRLRIELQPVPAAGADVRRLLISGQGPHAGPLAEELSRQCAL